MKEEIKKFNDDLYFKKYIENQRIYLNQNEVLSYEIEYRFDPITNNIVIINKGTKNKPREYPKENIETKSCIFCKENIFNLTPIFEEYPKEKDFRNKYITEKFGRMVLGNSILIPNKYPYYQYHILMIPNFNKHVENIKDLDPLDLYNGFYLIKEFSEYLRDKLDRELYLYINLNKGFYAGASQSHLHFQILISEIPLNYHRILIERSEKYYKKYNSILLEDYYKFEDNSDERIIKKFKYSYWYSSFAPYRNNEILGIVNSFGIFFLHDKGLEEFVNELYKILLVYENLYNSFNMTIYDTTFLLDKKILPFIRIAQRNRYDMGFLEALNIEYSVSSIPEETSIEIKNEIEKL